MKRATKKRAPLPSSYPVEENAAVYCATLVGYVASKVSQASARELEEKQPRGASSDRNHKKRRRSEMNESDTTEDAAVATSSSKRPKTRAQSSASDVAERCLLTSFTSNE